MSKKPRTLETIIRDTLDEISRKFGLPVNPQAMSSVSVMKMKTKIVVSVWNPLGEFDEGFVASLSEDGKRLMPEPRLTLCKEQLDDSYRSVIHIHSKYNDVGDIQPPEDVWNHGDSGAQVSPSLSAGRSGPALSGA